MNYVHSLLIPHNQIINCVVLELKLPKDIDVLIFYPNRVQIATITKKGTEINFKPHQNIFIEAKFLWATVANGYLYGVSKNNQLLISKIGASFQQIALYDLNAFVKSNYPFKYFSISSDKSMICMAGDSDFCFSIDISDSSQPKYGSQFFDGYRIKSIVSHSSPQVFSVLLYGENEKKIVTISPSQRSILEEKIMENNILFLIESSNPADFDYCVVYDDSVHYNGQQVALVSHKVLCSSTIVNGYFACQLENSSIITVSLSQSLVATYFSTPLFDNMWCLPNDVIVCSGIRCNNFLFMLPKFASNRKKSISFDSNNKVELKCISGANHMSVYQGVPIVFCDTGSYIITEKSIKDKLKLKTKVTSFAPVSLVSIDNVAVAAVGEDHTEVVMGKHDLRKSCNTLCFVTFRKVIYQVVKNSILTTQGENIVSLDENIRMALSNGFRLLIVYGNSNVVLYSESFQNPKFFSLSADESIIVSSAAIAQSFFSLFVYNQSRCVMNGILALYDFSFNKICQEIRLPSYVNSMVFSKSCKDLYISSSNGSIIRVPLSEHKGIIGGISLLHSGKASSTILPIKSYDNSFLVIEKSILLYIENRFIDLGIENFDSVAIMKDDASSFIISLLKGNTIYSYKYCIPDAKKSILSIADNKIAKSGSSIGKYMFVLNCEESRYSISVVMGQIAILKSSAFIGKPISLISVYNNELSLFYVVVALQSPDFSLEVYSFTEVEGIKKLYQQQMSDPISHLCRMNNGVIVITSKSIFYSTLNEKGISFSRCSCRIGNPISVACYSKGYLWCGEKSGLVYALCYSHHSERFELAAEAIMNESPTCVAGVDELSAVFGSSSGEILTFRIPPCVFLKLNNRNHNQLIVKGTINIGYPVVSVVSLEYCIVYLTVGGQVGAFSPFSSTSDFQRIQQVQDIIRNHLSKKHGIYLFDQGSIAQQHQVVDLSFYDLIENSSMQNELSEVPSTQETILQAISLISPTRENFLF